MHTFKDFVIFLKLHEFMKNAERNAQAINHDIVVSQGPHSGDGLSHVLLDSSHINQCYNYL